MRKDFGAKPFLYPQPVSTIATYGEDGTPGLNERRSGAELPT